NTLSLEDKEHHIYNIDIKKGDTIYIKADQYRNYDLKNNLLFTKLHVNQDNILEQDDKERTEFSEIVTDDPTITGINKTSEGITVTVEWNAESEKTSELSIYDEKLESIFDEVLDVYSFLFKTSFEAEREGVYDLTVSYSKPLPFSLIAIIIIIALSLIYPIVILILINRPAVKAWIETEEEVSNRPDILSQITGLNILLFSFVIWLSIGNLNGFLPSPHWTFNLLGLIGIVLILVAAIGIMASVALMNYHKSSKTLLKSYSYIGIIVLLINMVVNFIVNNFIPQDLNAAVDLLYNGIFPSLYYIPRASTMRAIIVAAGIVCGTGILIIYPLYIRSKLKSENISDYLEELKGKIINKKIIRED
ncbi:MAG: hypothetical protein ACOCV8_02290, partial [Spirochaetota bacterium]